MTKNSCEVVFSADQQEGTKSVIARWLKNVGDSVVIHEPLVEINTDKVSIEVPAPVGGVLQKISKAIDSEVIPGEVLGIIAIGEVISTTSKKPETLPSETCVTENNDHRLSPAVRKLLSENKILPTEISGSGKEGRITHEDVMAFLSKRDAKGSNLESKKIAHTPMRRRIAEHMVQSMLHTAPHVTTIFDCNLEAVLAHREKHKSAYEKRGARLTLTAYFVEASAKALKAVPEINSRFHENEIEIFNACNIGVATALEKDGLIVPVINDAGSLDLFKIAESLQDLTSRAREGKLSSSEVQGATFTITNHGVSGSIIATPIISQPQSAILGIGKLERRPVVVNKNGKESIEPQSRVYVTLTIDHRALDGFVANLFLSSFVKALEEWT